MCELYVYQKKEVNEREVLRQPQKNKNLQNVAYVQQGRGEIKLPHRAGGKKKNQAKHEGKNVPSSILWKKKRKKK